MIGQVKIGPDFFKKELREYSDWRWALIREALQNSTDAPSSNSISVDVALNADGNTVLSFENNGSPMDIDILCNKLLTLGESGKNFEGSVGGFGKAKVVLYLSHESYTIRTGTLEVVGRGGNFDVTEDLEYFHGTRSVVIIKGDEVERLVDNTQKFIALAQWHGTIKLNGKPYRCEMHKGAPRREFDFGKIYTNKSSTNIMVVRVGGIPMFVQHVSVDRCVILELSGSSLQTLTSNRDGLSGSIRWAVEDFVNQLATDKRKALKKQPVTKYQRFIGEKFNETTREDAGLSFSVSGLVSAFAGGSGGGSGGGSVGLMTASVSETTEREYRSQLAEMFIIKNETELKVPDYYKPNSPEFGTYAKKLAIIWGKLMLTMHKLFDSKDAFSIGFIFAEPDDDSDDTTLAEYEESDRYGKVYYLNPVRVVKQANSQSRSFKKRFLLTERNKLITYACHEFVHGTGLGSHNDEYSYRLTEYVIEVMDNRQKFNWCFQ